MNRRQRRDQATLQRPEVTAPASQPAANSAAVEADLAAAAQHLQAGRPQHAQSILTRVAKAQPRNPVALHLLGAVALQTGKIEVGVDHIAKAVAFKPDYAEAHYTLGGALMNQGKLDEAVASYRKAIALKPDYANAYINLGIARVNQGEFDEAVVSFRKAVALAPNVAQTHNNLGSALISQGKVEAALACYQQAIALRPDYAEAHYNLGYALKSQGKLERAVLYYRKAIALKPGYAEAHNNLGTALKDLGRRKEAVASYREAIALNPHNAEVHSNLGNALKDQGLHEEAVASHQMAILLRPNFAEAQYNLGAALERQGKLEEAVACYDKAIALKPDYAEAYNNLGAALMGQGRRDEAIARFRRAIEIRPAYFEAYYNHALVHRFRPDDPEIDKLKGLLARGDPSPVQRTRIRFALGKAHDDIGRHAEAFSYYSAANEEMARRVNFDATHHRTGITRIKRAFPERRVSDADASGDAGHVPVFVVGISRSGKTLVESLLTQHEDVYGAGESHEWWNAVKAVLDKYSISTSFPEYVGFLSDDQTREIGEIYMENMIRNSPDSRLFINTMPGNDPFIGLILQALPTARIIYCHRDPMDHCLFVYFYLYKAGHEFSYDLSHLASYYADRHDLMTHWQKLHGDCILSVRYEDLVRNPADVGARIYALCGLDFDPAAIRHGFTTDEIGHWKHYEPYLGALRQALGGLAQ